jgi:hypothetical protein
MQVDPKLEAYLATRSARRVRGEDYTVEIFTPDILRYRTQSRTLTLSTEFWKGEGGWWKKNWKLVVYVPRSISWDNEQSSLGPQESKAILSRIGEAVAQKIGNYEFIPTDQ